MAAQQPQPHIKVLKERKIDPTDDEIEAYAQWLGVDMEFERDLFEFAKAALVKRLRKGWRACQVEGQDEIFYWHAASQTTTWDHPNDEIYKGKLEAAREQRQCFVVTLSLERTNGHMELAGTSLAGEEVVRMECLATDIYGDLEDKLKVEIRCSKGMVLTFAKAGGSLIGHSARAVAVGQLLP